MPRTFKPTQRTKTPFQNTTFLFPVNCYVKTHNPPNFSKNIISMLIFACQPCHLFALFYVFHLLLDLLVNWCDILTSTNQVVAHLSQLPGDDVPITELGRVLPLVVFAGAEVDEVLVLGTGHRDVRVVGQHLSLVPAPMNVLLIANSISLAVWRKPSLNRSIYSCVIPKGKLLLIVKIRISIRFPQIHIP